MYDDMSMNGSNGPTSPIVIKPSDGEGPIAKMLDCAFYTYTTQFHWTVTMGAEDRLARSIVENIAHEQFRLKT